jgi:hypothetical protein
MKWGKPLLIILLVAVTLSLLGLLQMLVMPKYQTELLEGGLIADYYQEPVKDHDVIFVGDCEVYEDFSPITLWEDYGITSYIRGSAQQLIWQSYYMLEDTLRYEKPDVVIFNVLSMKYGEPQNEAYNRMSIDAMPLSMTKFRNIQASMVSGEEWFSYIFPLLRYHSRWNDLSAEDFQYLFTRKPVSHNGYLMRIDVKPVTTVPAGKPLSDYQFSENSYQYLDKMTALCKANDIDLILVKSPSLYPYWYEEWDQQIVDYAQKNDLLYVNTLDITDQIGIDYNTDTYDAGLHMNLSGAEKMARYFGKILAEDYGLADRRSDEKLAAIWAVKAELYNQQQAAQHLELETYGYLRAFRFVQD